MKLKQWIQGIIIIGTAVTLVGCHSARKNANQTDINEANAAYSGDVRSSGLGEESGFGDQAGGGHLAANKHVFYFDYDSNAIHNEDRPAIEANANKLAAKSHAKVLLEGHTDPRGSREYNIGLGERRAKSVAEVMTGKGVNPDQIRIVSYGAEKLASNGRSESDYQQDRRAVVVPLQD